jgi:hypothetical protein
LTASRPVPILRVPPDLGVRVGVVEVVVVVVDDVVVIVVGTVVVVVLVSVVVVGICVVEVTVDVTGVHAAKELIKAADAITAPPAFRKSLLESSFPLVFSGLFCFAIGIPPVLIFLFSFGLVELNYPLVYIF